MRPAVVVGVGWVAGLAAVRSLGRMGTQVFAVDHRESALGFRSRYADPRISPDRFVEQDRFVRWLGELDVDGPIFPTHDEDLNLISRRAAELPFLRPFPAWATLERVQDKRHQLTAAEELGLPVPRWSDEPTEELGFPVLVKPSDPTVFRRRFGVKGFRCDTVEQLERHFDDAREHRPLVQEWIPGGDDALYSLGAYVAEDGEALGLFSGRKLVQTPREIGTARVAEAVWVDEVVEQGLELLRYLGCHGISQVEFKRDPRDGQFKLIEVNPRLWEWHGLAAACGVDLPRIAYQDLVGERPAPVRMDGKGRRWAITLARGARPAFQRPPYVDAMWAGDDPKPAVVHWARALRP